VPVQKKEIEIMRETARQKIRAVALSLFSRKGLLVTIDEIAKAAALSNDELCSLYPSKETLITELMQQAAYLSGTSIKEIEDRDTRADVKIKQITAMMCEMLSNKIYGIDNFMFTIQVGMSGFPAPDGEWFKADMPHPLQSLVQIISAGQKEGSVVNGDPVQLATVYWAAIQGLCCFVLTGMPLPPVLEILSRIILKE